MYKVIYNFNKHFFLSDHILNTQMSQVKVLPQSKEALLKSYNKRLKDDIKSMVDNFTEIVKLARPTHEDDVGNVLRPLATCQDQCEMHVRASNIVSYTAVSF